MPRYRNITGVGADRLFRKIGVRNYSIRYRGDLVLVERPLISDEKLQPAGEFPSELSTSESLQHYTVSISLESLQVQLDAYIATTTAMLDADLASSTITQQQYDDAIVLLGDQYSMDGAMSAYVPWFLSYDNRLTWMPLRSKTIDRIGQVRATIELVTIGIEF